MAKPKKILASDLKKGDVILLDRPEVEVIEEPTDAKKRYRTAPKGARITKIKDKSTGQESEAFFLDDDKVDVSKRLTWRDKLSIWFDKNHKSYQAKVKTGKDLLPPFMK